MPNPVLMYGAERQRDDKRVRSPAPLRGMTFPEVGGRTALTNLDTRGLAYLGPGRCHRTGGRTMNRLTPRRGWRLITAIGRYGELTRLLRRKQTTLSKPATRKAFPATIFMVSVRRRYFRRPRRWSCCTAEVTKIGGSSGPMAGRCPK